jgi:hypothetical protein
MTPDDAPSLGTILGGSGAPFPVEHAGRTYRIAAPTNQARDVFHKLVVAAALKGAQQAEIDMPGLGCLDQFRRDYAAGKYKPGASGWREYGTGEKGNALFLAALLYQHHPDITPDAAEELYEAQPDAVGVALAEVMPPFFDILGADTRLPPPLRAGFRAGAEEMRKKVAEAVSLTPPAGSTTSSST